MKRLGLFLVYTLPPLSYKSESSEISDGDLSHNMSGITHRHMPYIICVMTKTACSHPDLSFGSCSSEFGSSQSYMDPQQVAICVV